MSGAYAHAWQALRRHWTVIRRVLVLCFVLAVITLLASLAREVDWNEVVRTLRAYPKAVLLPAAGLVVLSYLIYSGFDLLARAYTGHTLGWARVLTVAFISYAFNLNLGPLVGGVGFRYRLYTRLGIRAGIVTRILGFSVTSNWLGYLWTAGAVFASGAIRVPQGWELGSGMLRVLGAAMLVAAVAYLALCGLARKREYALRGHEVVLPSLRVALLQSAMGAASWVTIGAIIYVLLQQNVAFPLVLGTLMLAGVAGAVTHIPGGLGVIEAVFVAVLGGRVPQNEVLGALIAYRAIYYLCPLLAAAVAYAAMEAALKAAHGGTRSANAGRQAP